MFVNQEVFLVDFKSNFDVPARSPEAPYPSKKQILVWKILIVCCSVLLIGISAPTKESLAEISLNQDNLLTLLNAERTELGLAALEKNDKLTQAATAKALHMLENGYFAHTSPQGAEAWDFLKLVGFKYSFAGENLAINYTNASELNHDLLQSKSHRENLLSPHFTEVGIAVMPGTYNGQPAVVTVELFASPAESLAARINN